MSCSSRIRTLGYLFGKTGWWKLIQSELEASGYMFMMHQGGRETGGRDLPVINPVKLSWSCPRSLSPQHPGLYSYTTGVQ